MSLARSLDAGASSLIAHQKQFDVISNNIANTSTYGYKSSRANFSDEFSQTITSGKSPDSVAGSGVGGVDPLQYGTGVQVASVTQDMSQGLVESSTRPLDIALQGDGYFIYNENGKQEFSRAGTISKDKDGSLIDSGTGAFLQGYNVKADTSGVAIKDSSLNNILNTKVENIVIPSDTLSAPQQTDEVYVTGNINSGENRTTSIDIFDSLGGSHSLEATYTASTTTPGQYDTSFKIDGKSVTLATAQPVTFNNGLITNGLTMNIDAAALNTALGSTSSLFTKAVQVVNANSNSLANGLTNYSGTTTATASDKNGWALGTLGELSVDTEGKIWGAFSNGRSEVLGQVLVAKFANPAALSKQGNNMFVVSPDSGNANIGTAVQNFPSTKIKGSSLESSNVELTEQFTDIIKTQRAFEAAARTITVTDQMLSEVNQLKR